MIKKLILFLGFCALLSSTPLFAQASPWQLQSGSGLTLSIVSQLQPIEINRIHSWELHINNADGNPVSGAEITIEGGMPEHDHGLPTSPRVTTELEAGKYLLEGIRFHMPGFWQLVFTINTGDESSELVLEFNL